MSIPPCPICQNCGMPSTKEEETIGITLLFSKLSRQVLCVEAGKDFVDMLVGFLTLPMGCIVKLLTQAAMIHKPETYVVVLAPSSPPLLMPPSLPYTPSPKKAKQKCNEHFAMTSISNVFDSVVRFEASTMVIDKKCLLDPKPMNGFAGKLLSSINSTPEGGVLASGSFSQSDNYYGCGQKCSFVTTILGTKCPKHKSRKMETILKLVEDLESPEAEEQQQQVATRKSVKGELLKGYVKGGIQFMITNTLDIFASSAIKALITLNMLKTEKVGDLDTIDVLVNTEEMLQLLKASFSSTNVLNDVFGKYCENPKGGSKINQNNTFFFPQCVNPPCCQCSRMGPPIRPAHSNSSE
ncbi:unnamed protein product [Sphagnum jensenii]|uniref:Uncharacterized protein n=1 Tax=Sphagnum jensenii TaxID=128206 RepID=A0ABP0VQ10_9BRYO